MTFSDTPGYVHTQNLTKIIILINSRHITEIL